ncbi:MAG: hypothetical protein ACKO72_07455, partial [Actinomycetes bacterium]
MTALTTPIHAEQVTTTDAAVIISDLTEYDGDVLRVVADAPDPAAAVHTCLQVGAKALRAAGTAVDVAVVEQSFDAMATRFDSKVEEAVNQIAQSATALLDAEEGSLPAALDGFHERLAGLLGETFDPESKSSVVTSIEQLVQDVVTAAVRQVGDLVDPKGDESPLGQLRLALAKEVQESTEKVAKELHEFRAALGIAGAVEEQHAKSTAKGVEFEDILDEALAPYTSVHGDSCEQTGSLLGATSEKVGDLVIEINADDTVGYEARIVVEAKRKKMSLRTIEDELIRALDNREALVAVAVFDSQANSPFKVPFHYSGDLAYAVYDPSTGDDSALRLAYMWARWVARRKVAATAGDSAAFDVETAQALIEEATTALKRISTIKRNHSTATRAINQAATET